MGNAAQKILHGGVIASVLDVAAGLACVGSVLMRQESLVEEELAARLSRMGTIDLRVDYLRPGRGEHFIASASVLRSGNKVAVARVELHNNDGLHIASATRHLPGWLIVPGERLQYTHRIDSLTSRSRHGRTANASGHLLCPGRLFYLGHRPGLFQTDSAGAGR
ncbi:Uncharacterized protein, possibly involved in aromatic compounds catabolism [Serratia rubidaea]|uniref:Uncharacterized protein, possibly involved in aromatic compounds catabolism n=1 Tax=Serratia rubidaea TaxID=61652 RepID=A0A4U9HAM7_SERRU|nr:Uncharacterized protein, possibly involved in aromatic compounds catabolism [Serratia rubidaea]